MCVFEYARTSERLERHKLVVGLRRPRVQLDAVLKRHEQEADALEAHHLKVHAALEFAHIRPAVSLVHLQRVNTCNVYLLVFENPYSTIQLVVVVQYCAGIRLLSS